MTRERTSAEGVCKVAEPAPARLPLEAYYKVAGSIWLIRTNSPAILRSAEQTLETTDGRGITPDLSLHFAVNFDLVDKRPWPAPLFRGLNHLVYASYSSNNAMLIDLLHRSVIGSISPDMAQDAQYWRHVLLPVLLGSCSAAIGITPLHCACLVKNQSGLLLGGVSGAGKSTLSLSLARKGFAFLSDDWTYFRQCDSAVTAWGIPTVLKLLPDAVTYFPELARFESRPSLNGELAFEVDPVSGLGVAQSLHCRVGWIVFLERADKADKVVFERISSEEAFSRFVVDLEMLPPCVSQMRALQLQTVRAVASGECWVLRHGGPPHAVATEVAQFCEDSDRGAGIQYAD
jgi:hypothetical protein